MKALPVLLALCCLFFAGCATPSFNYTPERTELSIPSLSVEALSYVGESMLTQGAHLTHDAIYLKEDVSFRTLGILDYIMKTGYYVKKGEDDQFEYYLPAKAHQDAGKVVNNENLSDEDNRSTYDSVLIDKQKGVLGIMDVTELGTAIYRANEKSKDSFEKRKFTEISPDDFQQTLLYSGRIGDKVNISYREFSNYVARSAFNHDVEYDLSESMTIGYKGAQIEIIEATNELIRYKVLRNFNKAEF